MTVHPYAVVSGVYYVDVGKSRGHLFHLDPRQDASSFIAKGSDGIARIHGAVKTRVQSGLLVLFPSWMEHFVDPHTTKRPRIAIAFNARVQHVVTDRDGPRLKIKIPKRHV